jgi:hypothetical protein
MDTALIFVAGFVVLCGIIIFFGVRNDARKRRQIEAIALRLRCTICQGQYQGYDGSIWIEDRDPGPSASGFLLTCNDCKKSTPYTMDGSLAESRVVEHPSLGRLVRTELFWEGTFCCPDNSIVRLVIVGDNIGPNKELSLKFKETLNDWKEVNNKLRKFIDTVSPMPLDSGEFSLDSIDFLWPNRPNYFMVYLTKRDDEYGLWIVEFENGMAKYFSRDD